MECTEDQMTEWFDIDKHKPLESGVYEVEAGSIVHKWSLWDGVAFGWCCIGKDDNEIQFRGGAGSSVTRWRGLATNPALPSAPKKRAGNKRKTAYLLNVSRINHGIAPRVVAVFSSAKVANSQLEKELALMKNQDGATAWLTHIRFRTPEA